MAAVAVATSLLLTAAIGHASTFVVMSESDLARRSVAAVRGTVTAIEATLDDRSGGIHTYVHLTPTQVVFGDLPAGEIVLRETGGRVRGTSEWLYGNPEYRVGEDVLVFLSRADDGALTTTAMAMGKFSLRANVDGSLSAVRALGEGAAVWNPATGQLDEAPGDEVYDLAAMHAALRDAAARFAAKDRPAAARAVRLVPAELGQARVREAQAAFTYLSSPARWFEPDTAETIPYVIDAAGDVGLGATISRAAINDAFAAWTNAAGSDLSISDTGVLAAPISFAGCSGGNRIVFNDPFNEISDPSGCSGVLAVGGYCASSETAVVNGTSFRRIRVGKITFNNGWSQCGGWNRCNMSEVATHELGHTLGFGHSADFNATMYGTAHFDGRCATLRTDDLNALTFVYPSRVTGTPTPTATPLPPSPTATTTRPPTATPTPTDSRTPTATVPTATATVSRTPTATVPTATATASLTPTATVPTATASATRTATATVPPPTLAPTRTATFTRTLAPSRTATRTRTATATFAQPATATPTARRRFGVRGWINYYAGDRAVPGVTVNLRGESDAATSTTTDGAYEFPSVAEGSWELGAEKMGDMSPGVTSLDAAYVLQHIVQLRQLDATQQLACDVTGDGQLSALDAANILQRHVGALTSLPVTQACGSDWLFLPVPAPMSQQLVVAPQIASGVCSGGKIMIEDLLAEADEQNFRAVLFGDCTGNWQAGETAPLRVRTGGRAPLVRLGRVSTRNGVARVPVYVRSAEPFNALDLQLTYDDASLTPTRARMHRSPESALVTMYPPKPGMLRVAMASGEPIAPRHGVLMVLEFSTAGDPAPDAVHGATASIDEQPALMGR